MPTPFDRATGGANTRLFANGKYIGLVQRSNYQRVFQKVAVVESGSLRVREHVVNGVQCSLSLGFVMLRRRPLEDMGIVYPEDEDQILDFEPVTLEFRTRKGEMLIKAEEATASNDQFNFTREAVWGRDVSFDATWIRVRRA